jgi:hypothetical protein
MKRFLALAMVVTLGGCAKIKVVHLTPGMQKPPSANGVFYALPKTVVRVALTVEQNKRTGAPFIDFAPIFVPGADSACEKPDCANEKKTTFSLKKGATMTTFGTPDPNQVYMVTFVGHGVQDQSLNLAWTDTGIVSSVSASVTNRTTDIAVSLAKLAAGTASRLAFGAAKAEAGTGKPTCGDPSPTDQPFLDILTAPELIANYCSIPKEKRNDLPHANADLERLRGAVHEYLQQVKVLVDARNDILSGFKQVFEPVELVGKLDAMILTRLKSLFLGSAKTTQWNMTIDVEPPPDTPGDVELLKIDPANGICIDSTNFAPVSDTVPENFSTLKNDQCTNGKAVKLKLVYYPAADQQLFSTVSTRTIMPTDERSFYYRIPAQVTAEIVYAPPVDTKGAALNAIPVQVSYGKAVLTIAQYGRIASLPAKRNSKSLSYDLAMVESTGALKSFKLGVTGGIDSATIDALAGASNDLLDARNKAAKAAKDQRQKDEEAQSQLNQLKNEADILEQQDKICALQTKYGLPCTTKP